MALSGYLTFSAWQGGRAAFCAEGAGCDVVLSSRWATLLGMPTSFWGFLTYALLGRRRLESRCRQSMALGLGDFPVRFVFQSLFNRRFFFSLQAACPYCLGSLGLDGDHFLVTTLQRPKNLAKFSWGPFLGKAVGAAAIVDYRAAPALRRLPGQRS